jgi:hypothetical protein
MAVKKGNTKAEDGKEAAVTLLLELGNSAAAMRNLGREFLYGDGPVSAATMTTCVDILTATMLRDVDATLKALGEEVMAGFAEGEGVAHV